MKQNKRIMNTEMQTKIREWEAERDRNKNTNNKKGGNP